MVFTYDWGVGRHFDNVETVHFQKFFCGSCGGAGHTREFFVETKIILESDRPRSASFTFNFYTLLGFNCLMYPLAPAPAGLESPRKGIDDNYFPFFNHVIFVSLEKRSEEHTSELQSQSNLLFPF